MKSFKKITAIFIFFLIFTVADAANIDNVEKYAWGENTGWVNFNPTNGNVQITNSGMTGHIWSDNYGWINLQPTNGGVTNTCSGNLSGYAWNSNTGWIDFSGASVNSSTGVFSGILSGDNIGLIQLTGTNISVKSDWNCNEGGHSGSKGGGGNGSGSSKSYSCKDSTALNFSNTGIHKQSLCRYIDNGDSGGRGDVTDGSNIKNNSKGSGNGSNSSCPHFTKYFRLGDRDEEIRKVQAFLISQGFKPDYINGILGPKTVAAIKAFQARYSGSILSPWGFKLPTGRWYKSTRKKANELLGCKVDPVRLENGVILK